jgi:hypothetical protein
VINKRWNDDTIQFARLLCEIVATQDINIPVLCSSMDLNDTEINNLLDRALLVWERAKEAT